MDERIDAPFARVRAERYAPVRAVRSLHRKRNRAIRAKAVSRLRTRPYTSPVFVKNEMAFRVYLVQIWLKFRQKQSGADHCDRAITEEKPEERIERRHSRIRIG